MKTVLLVDSSRVARAMEARHLTAHVCRVREAGDLDEASRLLAAERVDLMLLDAGLCGPDGVPGLTALRSGPGAATVPVILVCEESQRAATASFAQGQSATLGILVKPFRRQDFAKAVGQTLGAATADRRTATEPDEVDARSVLIVDPSEAVLDSARRALERSLRVLTARSGEAAVELLRHERPGVLVVDAALPSSDGGDALDDLRHRGRAACVALAEAQDETSRARARRAGCHAVLDKPVAEAALREAVLLAAGLVASAEDLLTACLEESGRAPVLHVPRASHAGLGRLLEPLGARLRTLAQSGARGLVVDLGAGDEIGVEELHGLVRVVRDAAKVGLPVVLAVEAGAEGALSAAVELRAVPRERNTGEALARLG